MNDTLKINFDCHFTWLEWDMFILCQWVNNILSEKPFVSSFNKDRSHLYKGFHVENYEVPNSLVYNWPLH
jgi:hypothetical protein